MKLVTSILIASCVTASPTAVGAQVIRPPALDSIRGMALDSLGVNAIVYFRPEYRERAAEVQALLTRFLDFAREQLDIDMKMHAAVLDSTDWSKVTSTPYGLPTNSGVGADNLLLAAARPPERVGARRMPTGEMSDYLTVGHEGGHLLTWQLLPEALKAAASADERPAAEVIARFRVLSQVPAWYWEMAASYFATAFLRETQPDGAEAWLHHLRDIANVPRPRFTALDDWFSRVMDAIAADSTPYRFSDEGAINQGWYQGVVGLLAAHIHDRAGLGLVSHLRSTLAAPSPPTTQELVTQIEEIAPGATVLLTQHGVEWR